MEKTITQLISELTWFNAIEKLKEIFYKITVNSGLSVTLADVPNVFSFDYNHGVSTQAYTTGDLVLANDGSGTYTDLTQIPSGVVLYNTSTNTFDFSDLNIGDVLMIRLDISVTTTAANQIFRTWLELGQGVAPYDITFHSYPQFKTAQLYANLTVEMRITIMNELTRDNPAQFKFNSDANATIKVNGWNSTVLTKPQ